MNTCFDFQGKSLQLYRFPKRFTHPSWQAWDAADELLIEHINEHQGDIEQAQMLILNDDFGALTSWFNSAQICHISDSYVAQRAAQLNLEENQLPTTSVQFIDSLAIPAVQPDWVVIKIPKTLALLEHQLAQLQSIISVNTRIVAAAKVKSIQKSTLTLFEKYLGVTTTSLAKKKSRLVFCQPRLPAKMLKSPYPTIWHTDDKLFEISNHANVFARQQMDIAARLLINHLPDCSNKHVIDLGCGNGVLGLYILKNFDNCKVTFVDESHMAIASAQYNVEHNLKDKLSQCRFVVSNCLEQVSSDWETDIVLCNPPFHQQNTVTDHIAVQMFEDAKSKLKRGGELRIIGNRHLEYPHKLKKLFGGYQVIASDRKFSILSSIK
ncbi:methyltransferase [Aliiglaciecola sp. LCG003]|uniref:methyltransferase n=1 Tax=Aliiglaciecola sp. LCG003 TaxID=3053655 RepID=UPI002572C0CF|nr:methyltransferase [Aliiglaciecola sp. LCG003]WJG09010.1 methyltransferase [Aliiglaciecola sp. LCG003]